MLKSIFRNSLIFYVKGLFIMLLSAPIVTTGLFIIGLLARLFWWSLVFGFNLLPL